MLGTRLHFSATNPYAKWLANYTDPLFVRQTAFLWQMAEAAYCIVEVSQQDAMASAFKVSAQHEILFFGAGQAT
jgi:thiaminase